MFNDTISPPFPQILIANDFYGLRCMSLLFSFSSHHKVLKILKTTKPWDFLAVVGLKLTGNKAKEEAVTIFFWSIFVFIPSEQMHMTSVAI